MRFTIDRQKDLSSLTVRRANPSKPANTNPKPARSSRAPIVSKMKVHVPTAAYLCAVISCLVEKMTPRQRQAAVRRLRRRRLLVRRV